jgi:hypothetical protein
MQTLHPNPLDTKTLHGGVLTLKGIQPRFDAPVRPRAAPPIPVLDEFWFVWAPDGVRPKRRHASLESVQAEVQRLREIEPNRQFFIYRAVAIK